MIVEGVRYHRYVIRLTLKDGTKHKLFRWSPGPPWVRTEVAHELEDLFGVERIKPHSVTIRKTK